MTPRRRLLRLPSGGGNDGGDRCGRRARASARRLAVVAGLLLSVAACGDAGGSDVVPTDTATAPAGSVIAAASVPAPPASAAPAPTSAGPGPLPSGSPPPPVTLPVIAALPVPAQIPLEDDTPEPVVPLGSIAIPALGIDRPMFEGIRLPTFDLGPGHWPGSALPGQVGNVVVGGHRTEGHADFGDLDRLQPGDEVVFTDTAGSTVTYVVTATEIIDPFAAAIVHQTPAKTATLFACHPKGSTSQRIIVRLAIRA